MAGFARIRVIGLSIVMGAALTAAVPAHAQYENPTTPGAIANPGSYQGSLALQQQEQQSAAATQQQNAAMQQRLDQTYSAYAPNGRGGGGGGARRAGPPPVNWWARPALPADRNPLLGRWRQGALRGVSTRQLGDIATVANSMLSGACDSLFGKGTVAFEPDSLQWVAPDGHEEILNHVAYRAAGADVVVLSRDPGAIPALFFGFAGRDHAVLAFFGCTLERPGGVRSAGPAGGPGPGRVAGSTQVARADTPAQTIPPGSAVLRLTVGVAAGGGLQPLSAAHLWLTPEEPAASLARQGYPSIGGSALSTVAADCADVQTCNRVFYAMTGKAADSVRTDPAGYAQTKPLAPGRYYLVGVVPYQDKALVWAQAVDLKPGANALRLDQLNGQPVR
jgi:hypothetical protein